MTERDDNEEPIGEQAEAGVQQSASMDESTDVAAVAAPGEESSTDEAQAAETDREHEPAHNGDHDAEELGSTTAAATAEAPPALKAEEEDEQAHDVAASGAQDMIAEATNAEASNADATNAEATNGASADAAPVAAGEEPRAPFVVEEWMFGALEALVFASNDPLSPSRAREILAGELSLMEGREGMSEPVLGDVKGMFRTLLERWSDPTRSVAHGFRIVELDGGLVFRTVASHARFIRRMQMGKPQRLSRASLETLAVIAYRQPVTKPQIEEVRGVDSSGAIKALLDKKLIRVLGKAEEIGRPLLYGTTKTFLEFFELQSLTDLPTLKELHELEHGVAEPVPVEGDDRPAVVMDLFNADQVNAVSEETERESNDALEALEQALGQAKNVAKRASSLVFGMDVEDGEDGAPRPAPLPGLGLDEGADGKAAAPEPSAAAEEGATAPDEEPKA